MKKIVTAAVTAALLAAPVAVVPAASAVSVPTVGAVSTHYVKGYPKVKYPKAVPGRYCKTTHRKKHTHTKRYGVLKCKKKGAAWRWTR